MSELDVGKHLKGASQWTLRLVVEHRDGSVREARLQVNLG